VTTLRLAPPKIMKIVQGDHPLREG